jgi:hypothetical protein
MAVFNEVENGEKEKGLVWGKAFWARAEFAADGGPKILESGEEVNRSMLRAKDSVLDPKTQAFFSFHFVGEGWHDDDLTGTGLAAPD